jgi:hypothetical protein
MTVFMTISVNHDQMLCVEIYPIFRRLRWHNGVNGMFRRQMVWPTWAEKVRAVLLRCCIGLRVVEHWPPAIPQPS